MNTAAKNSERDLPLNAESGKTPTGEFMKQLVVILGVTLLLIAGISGNVLAQEKPAPPNSEERVLDFEGDIIESSFIKPDASLIEGELRKSTNSLLKERKDFVSEIVKSAEDI